MFVNMKLLHSRYGVFVFHMFMLLVTNVMLLWNLMPGNNTSIL